MRIAVWLFAIQVVAYEVREAVRGACAEAVSIYRWGRAKA
jgi:hypothetical protein